MIHLRNVSDEELKAALDKVRGRKMSREERRAQLISFVWGQQLEGDERTLEEVAYSLENF